MEEDPYRILLLHSKLTTANFDCGVPPLNEYLQRFAGQNQRRSISRTYVLVSDSNDVVGYYAISMAEIAWNDLPEQSRRKLPRHPIPAIRLGRLAVDQAHRGRGLGERLLQDSLERALRLREVVGLYAVLVDAKDDAAVHFYEHYGFLRFVDQPRKLFLPLDTVEKARS